MANFGRIRITVTLDREVKEQLYKQSEIERLPVGRILDKAVITYCWKKEK